MKNNKKLKTYTILSCPYIFGDSKQTKEKVGEALERIKKGETDGNEQSFLPTDPKVAERRMIDRSIWEYVMGYRRVDNSNQSELFKN